MLPGLLILNQSMVHAFLLINLLKNDRSLITSVGDDGLTRLVQTIRNGKKDENLALPVQNFLSL